MPVFIGKRNLGASTLLVLTLMACLAGIVFESTAVAASGADNASVATQNPSGVRLIKVSDSVWVHTSHFNYNGWPTPSNGMIIETATGLILIDTPWTCEQTAELLNTTWQMFLKKPVLAVITHAHQDRIGGIAVLIADNIRVISTPQTAQLAEGAGYPRPESAIDQEMMPITVGASDSIIEAYYPGPAHTADNIAMYFAAEKVFFGGCIVKSLDSNNLGNISEGSVANYQQAVQNLIDRYSDASIVIPGHGSWGGRELLTHTLDLAKAAY